MRAVHLYQEMLVNLFFLLKSTFVTNKYKVLKFECDKFIACITYIIYMKRKF